MRDLLAMAFKFAAVYPGISDWSSDFVVSALHDLIAPLSSNGGGCP